MASHRHSTLKCFFPVAESIVYGGLQFGLLVGGAKAGSVPACGATPGTRLGATARSAAAAFGAAMAAGVAVAAGAGSGSATLGNSVAAMDGGVSSACAATAPAVAVVGSAVAA